MTTVNPSHQPDLVPIRRAAEILGVSIDTVRRWEKKGEIIAARSDGGHRLFSVDKLRKYKENRPLKISQAADILGVSASTLRRYENQGRLVPERRDGVRFYTEELLNEFKKGKIVTATLNPVIPNDNSSEVFKDSNKGMSSLVSTANINDVSEEYPLPSRTSPESVDQAPIKKSRYVSDDPIFSSSHENASKYYLREISALSPINARTVISAREQSKEGVKDGRVAKVGRAFTRPRATRSSLLLAASLLLLVALLSSFQSGARFAGKASFLNGYWGNTIDNNTASGRKTSNIHEGSSRVLALTTQDLQQFMEINIPTLFRDQVSIDGLLHLQNNVEAPGQNINLGSGTITASNLVNSIQGQTGDLSLQAGSGIAIDGLTISATATGAEQDALKSVKVGGDTFTASDPNAVLTVIGSGSTSLSLNKNTGTLTISTTDDDTDTTYTAGSDLALSGTEFSLASTLNSVSVINLSGTGKITGLDEVDTASEDTIEALVFDSDTATIAGAWTVADTVPFSVGTGGLAVTGETTLNGVAYTWPNADGEANQVLTTDASGNLSWATTLGGGSGDVTAVGDCVSGNCFDGTSDGGTYISFYDAQGAGQLITGNLTQARTWTLPDLTGTVILSGHALTGDVTATLDASGSTSATVAKINGATLGTTTATSGNMLVADGSQWVSVNPSGDVDVASGGIMTIQADSVEVSMLLDDGTPPSDEHCLTYEATGGTFAWQDCNAASFTSFDITDDDIGAETETVTNGETITFADGSGIDVDVTATNTVAVALNHLGIQNLMDPGADRMFFWDESDNAAAWLAPDGTVIQISGSTLQIGDDSIDGSKLADTITLDANLSFQDADTNNLLTLSDAGTTGNLSISGDLTVTGGDITLGTTSIFSGGDTTSLNNIDAINATTETTLETALDIAGDVTGTGLTAVTVAKINGVTLGTTTATSGNLLIGDGDSWESNAMSGDASIAANGALTITADAIDGDELADAISLDSATLIFDDGTNTLLTLTDDGTTGSLNMTGALTVGTTTTLGGGTYTWPINDGDADQVLTSNGSGTLSWAAVSSLASGDITAVGTCNSGACFTESNSSAYSLYFEGATDDEYEVILASADATGSDKTITLPNASGTVILSGHTFTGDVTGTVDSDGSTALSIAADVVDGDELADAISLDSATLVFDDGTNTLLTLTDDGTTGSLNMTGALTVGTTTTFGGGTYTWPGDDGNADQVLVSNGAGTLSWQDVGGVGAGDGDITAVGTCSDGACFTAADTSAYTLYFEGATPDDYEVILAAADATGSDKTITLPNSSGTVILSGHTFTGDVTGTLDTDGSTALTVANINGATLGTVTASSGNLLIGDGDSWESVAMSGDATLSSAGALTIASDAIEESMLKVVNGATDEYCLTYETTTGDFEWQACDSGSLMSSFIISDDEGVPTTQTINDGETVTFADTSTVDLAVAATSTVSASIVADSINYTEMADALSLDASTALSLGTYDYDINLNSSGVFAIQDEGGDIFAVDANGKITIYDETDFSLAAGEDINIAATAAPTTDVLVLSNNGFGTTTNGVDGMYIDFTAASDAASGDTNAAISISATASGDTGDSLYGLNIASTGISAGTLYGLNIPGITAGAGTEYALVIGTGWDKGMYVQSAAEFTSSLVVDSTTLVVNASGYEDKVGIGDSSPDQLLEVLSSGAANTQLSIGNINAGDYDAQIGFELADGTNTFTMGVDDSDSDKFKISTTALGTSDRFVIDSTGNTTVTGDLTISGDDLTMATNTAGYILVADSTNYNPVAVSGDATLSSAGALTIASNAVTLGTDTTGNYVATIADAGNGNITVANSGTETAAVTLDITADSLDFAELEDTLDLDAALTINTSGNDVVWNEDGADSDFRIEGDTEANLVFVDASADKVGIGTNTPSEMLSVVNTSGVANLLIKGEVGLGHTRSELIIDRDSDVRGGGMRIQATNVSNTYNGEWWVGAPYFSGNSHGRFSIAYHDTDADNVTSGMFQIWSGGKVQIGDVDMVGTPSTSIGSFLYVSDRVFTDTNTAASGTASGIVFNSFNTPTLAADNTGVTTTNAANVYIQSAPTAGTNETITNAYALWVDAGNARFDGQVDAGTNGDGLVTKVNAGACSDSTFTTDTDGTMCVDSSNGRLYFRYGGAWHYTAQTAGFQIPNLVWNGRNETEGLNPGDYVIGKLDERMSDGALHGVYVSINELIPDLDYFANTDDKLSLLEMRLSDVEERLSSNIDSSGSASTATSPSKDEENLFLQDQDSPTNLLFAKDLTLQGLLSVYGNAVFESELTVKSDVTMYASLVVDSVHIANSLNVHGDTNLFGNLTVAKDAQIKGELSVSGRQAGTAKIPRGGQEVTIEFEQPLVYTPIVQVSLQGDAQDVNYSVDNVTQTGFTLKLSAMSHREVSFSWIALSAENSGTVTGSVVDKNNNGIPDIDEEGEPLATPTASPEKSEGSQETEEDSLPAPHNTESIAPSPTTLVPSPTASPSGVPSPSPQQTSVPQSSPQNSVPII